MKRSLIVLALAAVSCDPLPGPPTVDQCLRRDLFERCMKSLPAGPAATQYNDWAEVVEACESAAYHQALRREELITPECRASR